MWEIREKRERPSFRKSMKGYKDSVEEAYECGYEDGYKDAMKEVKKFYSERSSYGRRHDDEDED